MNSPDLLDAPQRPRGRWRWLVLAGVLLVPPLGFAGLYLYESANDEREVAEAVAETDRRDPGWRFEDLERQRRTPPDHQNAALQVIAVKALMPRSWPTPAADGTVPLDDLGADLEPQLQFNDEQLRELRAELERVKPALKKADRLADLPEGRYTIAWKLVAIDTLMKDLQNSRPVANLLRHEASRRAQDGDMEGACRAELALINTGRSIGDEYTLIPLLVRTSLLALATRELERVLAQGEADEKSLAAVQQLLEREDRETPAARVAAFRGERALTHRMLEAVERRELSLSSLGGTPGVGDRIGDALNAGMVRHSHALYLRSMTESVEAARAPGPEQSAKMKELDATFGDLDRRRERRAMLALLLLPATNKVMSSVPRKLAWLRAAIAGVAAERYRRAHGAWPESLEALAPAYLGQVPADPYDRQPLRYRRLPDGVVFYSVGPDGTDNDGHLDRKEPLAEGNDLGIRLWDVKSRRQPPLPPKSREEEVPGAEAGDPGQQAPQKPER
jgi:hypothetical protein